MAPERYAANAMYEAIGVLRAVQKEGDGLSLTISKLEHAIEKIGGKDECMHGFMVSYKSPDGGYDGTCSICGEKVHTDRP